MRSRNGMGRAGGIATASRDRREARRAVGTLAAAVVTLVGGALPVAGQGLAELDYEYLSLRGIMLDGGYIFPTTVDGTSSMGGRLDLGFLGPGVRATIGFTRWSSRLKQREVSRFESRIEEMIFEETGETTTVDLGEIRWRDTAIHADVHMLWRLPIRVLTYAGGGLTAHILRGSGPAVDGTFVEDLLDSVRAGVNAHLGLEFPLHPRLRVVGEGRFELLENLRYGQLRVGGQFTFGALAPGES